MESKRKILYDTIEKSCIHFKHLNNKNKLIWLLNTEDNNIPLELCKFLCLIYKCVRRSDYRGALCAYN